AALSLEKWLISFPSYGFLLSVRPQRAAAVQRHFQTHNLVCEAIGIVTPGTGLSLKQGAEQVELWDLSQDALTGFSRQAE
ncbi:MAG: hypothetical protein AAF609_20355, partial [Cyanobacteria bacterium P01_C01_bin.120]